MDRTVPKSEATILGEKIDQLMPNDLHNLESPSIYLDAMRAKSQLEPATLAKLFHSPQRLEFREKIYKALNDDHDFHPVNQGDLNQVDIRDVTNRVFFRIIKSLGYSADDFTKNPEYFLNVMNIAVNISGSVGAKIGVHFGLYCGSLDKLGTEKHKPYLKRARELKELGCFCMTEVAHGSNLQSLLTTATYIHSERCFILNTPHELGKKYWVGNLAKFARYGVVFANLLIDGQNYGIHAFVVELRDEKGSFRPGIIGGDVGSKLGINGVDNGWCSFRRVKLPYDALLDKFSQITPEGQFVSPYKKKSERFASQLSALSSGRLAVATTSCTSAFVTGGVALRYLSVRKQFGEKKFTEQPLVEYPLVVKRIVPPLCEMIVYDKFIEILFRNFVSIDSSKTGDPAVKELHAASSIIKYLSTHKGMETTLIARELCGGHGYSEHSRIPDYIKDQNVQSTWEGANDVLIQQTAKYLLSIFRKFMTRNEVAIKSFSFLPGMTDDSRIQREMKAIQDYLLNAPEGNFEDPTFLMSFKRIHQLRLKLISESAAEYFTVEMQKETSMFATFNKALPDHLVPVSICWGHYVAIENYEEFIKTLPPNSPYSRFALRALLVFAANSLRSHTHFLSGIVSTQTLNKIFEIERTISSELIPDLVVFIDQELPPDTILGSSIGSSTGEYFHGILSKLYNSADLFGRSLSWNKLKNFV